MLEKTNGTFNRLLAAYIKRDWQRGLNRLYVFLCALCFVFWSVGFRFYVRAKEWDEASYFAHVIVKPFRIPPHEIERFEQAIGRMSAVLDRTPKLAQEYKKANANSKDFLGPWNDHKDMDARLDEYYAMENNLAAEFI